MHLTLSDPKDMKSPRHVTAFGRAAEDLKKGELLFDEDTKTLTYREINDEEKKAQRADQALADMTRAEDAIRLALLQATEPLRAQDLCDAAGANDQGRQTGRAHA